MDQSEAAREEEKFFPFAATSPSLSLADAYAYCRRITQRSSSNFYYAFRLLPSERHNALCAFYAFCRFLDDITDQPTELLATAEKHSTERTVMLLNTWRDELQVCYAGVPRHPISLALSDTVRRFPIDKRHLAGIIDGVEMDLYRSHYQTFADLYDYCYHVASLVGLTCIEILGYRHPDARDYAVNLGIAFQLTNILRDVGEDVRRGRIYLPQEDLVRFGYSEQELRAEVYNEAFVRMMTFEGERAKEYYRQAVAKLALEDRHNLAAAEAMRFIYLGLLKKLITQKFQVFGKRIALSNTHKICLALSAWIRGRLPF